MYLLALNSPFALTSLLNLQYTTQAPASGPLPELFCQPGMLFPLILTWLAPPCHSSLSCHSFKKTFPQLQSRVTPSHTHSFCPVLFSQNYFIYSPKHHPTFLRVHLFNGLWLSLTTRSSASGEQGPCLISSLLYLQQLKQGLAPQEGLNKCLLKEWFSSQSLYKTAPKHGKINNREYEEDLLIWQLLLTSTFTKKWGKFSKRRFGDNW